MRWHWFRYYFSYILAAFQVLLYATETPLLLIWSSICFRMLRVLWNLKTWQFYLNKTQWQSNFKKLSVQISSVTQSCLILCDPMNCSTPGLPVHHQPPEFTQVTSIESVMPSSHFILCRFHLLLPQSLQASESFPMSQLFAWGGQSTGVSALASFLPKKSQGWSPSEWTGWFSLQSKGLSRVFSNTTLQKHQFFST